MYYPFFQDGKEFASNNGLMFTEVSAKTGMNVDEVFTNLGQYIHSTVQFNIPTNNTYLQCTHTILLWPFVQMVVQCTFTKIKK